MKNDPFLPNIHSPADLKPLSDREIPALAAEIRQEIIAALAENGGHLASNLGMVEATLALHRTFSCTAEERSDTIVFDVGHQCYTHKLLTGRFERFRTIRKDGGISGFTNRKESPYDTMTCGHSGSSVSAAMGIAEANRLRYGTGKDAPWTIAVVGDGSFTNGMIFEALNSLAGRRLNLIILLNDNEMSISKNVGGLSKYLAYIRTSESYFTFKLVLKRLFSAIPLVGNGLVRTARAVRDFLKRVTNSESFFENLGLEYIGPVDGNDYRRMVHVLEEAKSKSGPVIVHMKTKKGLGYAPAEEHPERFHSAAPFDTADGAPNKKIKSGTTFTQTFSDGLCSLAAGNDRICAITAAMTDGCGLAEFSVRFPDRFFDVGIAEEHAAALAGGLAMAGMIPVYVLYSTFAQRIFDQLWHDIRLQNVHAVIVLSHCGFVPGDGVTHQGLYDAALFRSIPDITVYSPSTADDLRRDLGRAVYGQGLCIVRYPKDTAREWQISFTEENDIYKRIRIGTADRLLVLTYGRIAHDVAAVLTEENIPAELIVLDRILPLPSEKLREITDSAGFTAAVVVEEGVTSGGIGEAIAAVLPLKTHIFAVDDPLIPHGSLDSIQKNAGLDRETLAAKFRAIL
ncbi:MAG: 1-deoxy-D-xylulose-5-phosphate synthase [Clostridia bacterium]|nr:1-deoxy-D-xylulose-5-phosphate synthase [Clostridia bacterium]